MRLLRLFFYLLDDAKRRFGRRREMRTLKVYDSLLLELSRASRIRPSAQSEELRRAKHRELRRLRYRLELDETLAAAVAGAPPPTAAGERDVSAN